MKIPIHEETKTLAEFYPDAAAGQKLHYNFVHRFLVQYVHDNPFNFILHDTVDPTRFIQARWNMMEMKIGLQGGIRPDGSMLFRRVADMDAWAQDVAGNPGVFVKMPVPEMPGCAFFFGAILLTPAKDFRAMEYNLRNLRPGLPQFIAEGGQPALDLMLAPFRAAHARVFTLERSIHYEGEQALRLGRLCEWTATQEHRNSGLAISTTKNEFAGAVSMVLQRGDPIPAVASHRPRTDASPGG